MSSEPSGVAWAPWSEHEVELVFADYFSVLRAELLDGNYIKGDHRRCSLTGLFPCKRKRPGGSRFACPLRGAVGGSPPRGAQPY